MSVADNPENPETPPHGQACPGSVFVTTHWSVVVEARDKDSPDSAAALEKLCQSYWYPLYAHVRRLGHAPPDAEDLTQEFFARLLQKGYLEAAESGGTRLNYLALILMLLGFILGWKFEGTAAVLIAAGWVLWHSSNGSLAWSMFYIALLVAVLYAFCWWATQGRRTLVMATVAGVLVALLVCGITFLPLHTCQTGRRLLFVLPTDIHDPCISQSVGQCKEGGCCLNLSPGPALRPMFIKRPAFG